MALTAAPVQIIRPSEEKFKVDVNEHVGVVRKVAWTFAQKYSLDFDDLFQEACLACLLASTKYDPKKSAPSTYFWHVAQNALRDLIARNRTFSERHVLVEISEEYDSGERAEDSVIAKERLARLMNMLSSDAREMCEVVLSGEPLLPVDRPRISRSILTEYMQERGWSKRRIHRAFHEIRRSLSIIDWTMEVRRTT